MAEYLLGKAINRNEVRERGQLVICTLSRSYLKRIRDHDHQSHDNEENSGISFNMEIYAESPIYVQTLSPSPLSVFRPESRSRYRQDHQFLPSS